MKERFLDYFYNNISSVFWSLFVVIGGLVFIFYYSYIEYMPEFDLKSAVAIVSAAAITSVFTMFLFIFTFILPAILWSEGLTKNFKVRGWLEDENGESRLVRVSFLFSFSIVGVFVFLSLVIFEWRVSLIYALFAVLLVVSLFQRLFLCKGGELAVEVIKYLFLSLVVSCVAILPVYAFISLFEATESTSKGGPMMVGIPSAIFIVFANIMVINKPKGWRSFYCYFGIGVLCFFIVFSSFEKFHRIPERTMEIYKFGAIESDALVLDKVGCRIISTIINSDVGVSEGVCELKDAVILSRLGKDMYLSFEGKRFVISNERVLSWSVREN